MTPEQENFDALRRLLKLKRYEQPPPRYFNDFSQQVIAQIKAGTPQDADSLMDRLSWQVPWLRQLLDSFQAKPALAVGFGAAMCALLVGGVIYSESLDFKPVKPVALVPEPENWAKLQTPTNAPPGFGLKEPSEIANGNVNTNSGSLFDSPPLNLVPVNFQLGNGGN